MEGIRMVDEWPIIEKKIPSMDIVFRPAVEATSIEIGAADGDDGPAPEPKRGAASSASKIRLTPDEERIFRKVDGTRTVQGIIDSTGIGEFETCRTLFDLLNRNLITTAGRGATQLPEAGPAESAVSSTPGYVVAALAVLIAAGSVFVHRQAPFAVVGLPAILRGTYDQLLESVTRTRLERLDRAVQAHHLVHGSVPQTLEDLVAEGLVDRSYLKDPWARPFHYALTESGYLLNAVDDTGRRVPSMVIERSLPAERP
jgi:hypothetical protein